MLKKFFRWLAEAAQRARMQEINEYLSKSTDHADLERRMQDLQKARYF